MFDWRTNLDLARALGDGGTGTPVVASISEATYRCAVGRAYYAAFGHARAYAIRRQGFSAAGTASDHGRLIQHYDTIGQQQIARRLRYLRGWRNQCDYDQVVPRLQRIVRLAIRDAAAVIRQL